MHGDEQGNLNVWYVVCNEKELYTEFFHLYEPLKRFQFECYMMELGSIGDDGMSARNENQL